MRTRLAAALLAALWVAGLASADAGVLRLRQTVDTLVVSVFTSPTPLRAGPVDVEVLLQDRASLAPLSGARVSVRLATDASRAGQAGHGQGQSHVQPAAMGHASNRLLHAARLAIPETGRWQLEVEASGPDFHVQLATALDVAERRSPLRRHWAALAFPPLGVALFALHRWLIQRR